MPDPIEAYWVQTLTAAFNRAAVTGVRVLILSATGEDWRFRVEAGERMFEAGFNHREQLWCREVTPGREQHLLSNDEPRIGTSAAAQTRAVERIARAIRHPECQFRDPPVM